MTRDREKLQAWYRQAMLKRIAELRDLRGPVRSGDPAAYDAVRRIGQALRGSGATFGFPRLTSAATLVETSTDADVLRRLEGLVSLLGDLTRDERAGVGLAPEWMDHAVPAEASTLPPGASVGDAWLEVMRAGRLEPSEVTALVADYLSVPAADLGNRGRRAQRLVPEALVRARRVVPMSEDAATITVATSDPTSLEAELELQSLTGRVPSFSVAPPDVIDALIEEIYGAGEELDDAAAKPEGEPAGAEAGAAGSADENDDGALVDAPSPGDLATPGGAEHAEPDVAAHSEPGGTAAPAPVLPGRTIGQDPTGSFGAGDQTVLVVDDEASARLLIRAILEKRGWLVVEACDGVEALDVVKSGANIGLVVADLNMPRMDGLELIWALREGDEQSYLPIIVVTGERDEILETQLLEEGADDYVRKPVDPRLFLARVESTLRRTSA